jgi:hypothetical protein
MSNGFPDRKTVERIRAQYPAGTRVRLLSMDDPQAPPIGTEGTVLGVDDAGHIMMSWDSGGSLNLVYGVDRFQVVPTMTDKVREQILAVRATGRTNMFDTNAVQVIADEMHFYELVVFIEEHKDKYARFILTGEQQ